MWLENEAMIIGLVGQALSAIAPGCLVKTYTIRGFPGRGLGLARQFLGADEVPDVSGCRPTFSKVLLPVMRGAARRTSGWLESVRDGIFPVLMLRETLDRFPDLRALAVSEWGFFSATVGNEPVGGASLLVPGAKKRLSEGERRHLQAAVPRLAQPLRLAALVGAAPAGLSALDHLLSSRANALFVLSPSGHLFAASPAGERLLARLPGLVGLLGEAVRTGASNLATPHLGLEIHVSPCSARGSAPAFLALVGSRAVPGRGRLTQRQIELLALLGEGLTNRQIGRRMGLAPSTVKTMLERLYRHAAVSGRVALLRWAQSTAELGTHGRGNVLLA